MLHVNQFGSMGLYANQFGSRAGILFSSAPWAYMLYAICLYARLDPEFMPAGMTPARHQRS